MYKPPEKIYLQVDPEGESADDFFDGVTWCADRINNSEVEYVRVDIVSDQLKKGCNSKKS